MLDPLAHLPAPQDEENDGKEGKGSGIGGVDIEKRAARGNEIPFALLVENESPLVKIIGEGKGEKDQREGKEKDASHLPFAIAKKKEERKGGDEKLNQIIGIGKVSFDRRIGIEKVEPRKAKDKEKKEQSGDEHKHSPAPLIGHPPLQGESPEYHESEENRAGKDEEDGGGERKSEAKPLERPGKQEKEDVKDVTPDYPFPYSHRQNGRPTAAFMPYAH